MNDNPLNYNFSAFNTGGIYSLRCPFTNLIFYVGLTTDLDSREKAHIRGYEKGAIGCHERLILSKGAKPIFEVLEYIFIPYIGNHQMGLHRKEYMSSMEVYWIAQIRAWGFDLLNVDLVKPVKYRNNYFDYKHT